MNGEVWLIDEGWKLGIECVKPEWNVDKIIDLFGLVRRDEISNSVILWVFHWFRILIILKVDLMVVYYSRSG